MKRYVLFGLVLGGCLLFSVADMPLQTLTVEGFTGDEMDGRIYVGLKPLYMDWTAQEMSVSLFVSPWIRFGSDEEFSGVVDFRMTQASIVDAREAYVEFRQAAGVVKVGRVVPELGINLLINPSDISPLSFMDPVHPDRMGLWGMHLQLGSHFGGAAYLTQGALVTNEGPYRILPEELTVGSYSYQRDLGFAFWIQGEGDWYRWQWIQNVGVDDRPQLRSDSENPLEVDFFFESAMSTALGTEFLFDVYALRHEIRYMYPEVSEAYTWGVLELNRLWFLGLDRKVFSLTPFWAYTIGSETFEPYDRLRKQAAGFHATLDLTANQNWQWAQELSVGTFRKDFYAKTAVKRTLTPGSWVEGYGEYRDLEGGVSDSCYVFGLRYGVWFR